MEHQSKQLPDKPSDLLTLALADLKKVERSSKYKVAMSKWHMPTADGACAVCMAGAVIAKTLEVERFKERTPSAFETDTEKKLCAIDYLRRGDLTVALYVLGFDHPRFLVGAIDVVDYQDDPQQFKKDMQDLIKALKGEGL